MLQMFISSNRWRTVQPALASVGVMVAAGFWHLPAQAQQIPGLIVSIPSEEQAPTGQVPPTSLPPGARPGVFGAPRPQTGGATASAAPVQKPAAKSGSTNSRSAVKQKPRQPRRVASPPKMRKHVVAILVNDEPITHHEIDQRARLLAMNNGNLGNKVRANFQALIKRKSTSNRLREILKETIDANPGRSRDQILAIFEKRKKDYAKALQQQAIASARASAIPAQRNRARNELIEERLKLQEAKRLNVLASRDQVEQTIESVAQRNKITATAFLNNFARSGVNPTTFKERIKAQISWAGVVRRVFGRQIALSMADVDRYAQNFGDSDDIVLKLQKITLQLPSTLGQGGVAARLREAELARGKFNGCNSTAAVARNLPNATFQDLGSIKTDKIAEPTRSLLAQAKDGEMLPPITKTEGVVLYAVCGRNAAVAKEKARDELQQREFEIMSRRHLADLKRDAHIEYR
jgi:peptidyl-prolyl cis-trans isomerase SurA